MITANRGVGATRQPLRTVALHFGVDDELRDEIDSSGPIQMGIV